MHCRSLLTALESTNTAVTCASFAVCGLPRRWSKQVLTHTVL